MSAPAKRAKRLRDAQDATQALLAGRLAGLNSQFPEIRSSDRLNRDPFKLHPMCLVTQASNPAPQFDDDSEAMVRRVIALHMTYEVSEQAKVLDLAEKVKRDEYALLVAFALIGAGEVVEAGTIVVPKSIADFSANIVRPVRPVDRFMGLLEYGHFEVADDELYEAYCQTCVKQKLTQGPRSDFFEAFERRLRRAGRRFLRRAGAELYVAQTYINSRNERPLLVPQLQAMEHIDIFLGLRIGQGPFGPAIGQAIPEVRRRVPAVRGRGKCRISHLRLGQCQVLSLNWEVRVKPARPTEPPRCRPESARPQARHSSSGRRQWRRG